MAVVPYTQQLYRGLSTDDKPTGEKGDEFTETNTGKTFKKEANGWTEIITSDDLKSGSVACTKDVPEAVTFTTAFTASPNVTLTAVDVDSQMFAAVSNISVNGFSIHVSDGENVTVHWIATSAGNA